MTRGYLLHGSQEKLLAVRERSQQLPEPWDSLRGQGGRGHGSSLCPFPALTTASAADPGKASQRPELFLCLLHRHRRKEACRKEVGATGRGARTISFSQVVEG